jgi:hypothetical protein
LCVPLSVGVAGEHGVEEGGGAGEGGGEVALDLDGGGEAFVGVGPGGWGRWKVGG